MSKKRTRRLNDDEAHHLGLPLKPEVGDNLGRPRYQITKAEWTKVLKFRKETARAFKPKEEEISKDSVIPLMSPTQRRLFDKKKLYEAFDLAAWNADGTIMSIDQFCAHHKFDKSLIHDYRLCTHTKVPTYNISWKKVITQIKEDLTKDFLRDVIAECIHPVKVPHRIRALPMATITPNKFDRAVYADVHIGMDPDQDGKALYPEVWNEDELMKRAGLMVEKIIRKRTGNVLLLDDLGDLADGWDGETVRKGHKLPQNMNNREQYRAGVRFKVYLVDMLLWAYDKVIMHNICEDNHSGDFGYIINEAVREILEAKYPNKVEVVNLEQFINHYTYEGETFAMSHGKDSKHLKFGFKIQLDDRASTKIDQYMKQYKLYNGNRVQFCKGDSHQYLLDMCTSDDFDYFNIMAFSPSSEWVQTNFKKGRSGFHLEHYDTVTKDRILEPIFF